MTECYQTSLEFPSVKRRKVEANFSGGDITSNGGIPLLSQVDRQMGLILWTPDLGQYVKIKPPTLESVMKRKTFNSEFKAKVAIAALKVRQTTNEIGHHLGCTQVNTWKKRLLESSSDVFGKGKQKREADFETERESLYSQIGRLKVEVDWLKKRPDISTECGRKSCHDRAISSKAEH